MTSNNSEENISYRFLLLLRWLLRKHQFNQLSLGPASGTRICPPVAALPFVLTEKDYDALSSVIYNLYDTDCMHSCAWNLHASLNKQLVCKAIRNFPKVSKLKLLFIVAQVDLEFIVYSTLGFPPAI